MEDFYHKFIASDGTEISYVDMGEGKPLLFVHGFGGSSQLQIPIFELLKNNFRCLCFDQRGYGKTSANGEVGIYRSAKDAKELIEYLGIEDVIFLGYSMGAAVMFAYIEQFGCAHLAKTIIGEMTPKVINDENWHFGLYQGWYTKEQLEKDIYNMENGKYDEFNIIFAVQTFFKHTPDEKREFDLKNIDISSLLEKAGAGKPTLEALLTVSEEQKKSNVIYWKDMTKADFRETLEKITVPTAIIYAVPGSIYDQRAAKYMEGKIKNSTLYRYDDCTHMAKNERLEQFIANINEFSYND